MKTHTKRSGLPGVSMEEDLKRVKKNRPDIHQYLKNPSPRVSLAWNVVALRTKKHMTQEVLAQKVGISSRTIISIENVNNHYNPTLDVITGIAKAFGVKPEDLIKKADLTALA